MKTGDFVRVNNYLGVIFDEFPEFGDYQKYIRCREAESRTWNIHNIIGNKALLISDDVKILANTAVLEPV